jgi:drug/metabolite transporter superfamily protein YnfA
MEAHENKPDRRKASLSRKARLYLLGVGLFCGGAFAAGGLRYTAVVDRTPPDAFDYAFWLGIAAVLLLPLWASLLAPARWPRVGVWLRRICAVYLAFPLALAANVVVHNLQALQHAGRMNETWFGIGVLATLSIIGAQIILIRPDFMRSRHRWEDC